MGISYPNCVKMGIWTVSVWGVHFRSWIPGAPTMEISFPVSFFRRASILMEIFPLEVEKFAVSGQAVDFRFKIQWIPGKTDVSISFPV